MRGKPHRTRAIAMRILRPAPIATVALLGAASALCAQRPQPSEDSLPRRVTIGASLALVPDSLAAAGVPHGAMILGTVPGSSAAAAGLMANDVIVRIGHDTVTNVATALAAVRPLVAGTRVQVAYFRGRVKRETAFVARERARETSPEFDVTYTAVTAPGGRRRVLVAHPKDDARHPAVLLLGGIGCYSIDQAGGPNAYRDLMYHLARRGYTTIRVEKAGVGDSEGGPCLTTEFATELAGYRAALDAAREYPWVDPTAIVLFGHSIGGLEAPLLAGQDTVQPRVRGVIVLSTVGIGWYEYELANLRRQLELQHLPPDSVERDMSLKVSCGFHFLVERQSRTALLGRQPECEPFVTYPASDSYMQDVASHPGALSWRDVQSRALVLCGGADFITSCDEHRELTAAINKMHPGAATFAEIPELDHYLAREPSQAASFADKTPGLSRPYYGGNLEPVVDAWLDHLTRGPG